MISSSSKKLDNGQSTKPFQPLSKAVEAKIHGSLMDYVYKQIAAGLISSVLCATAILIGVLHTSNNTLLFAWYIILVLVNTIRYIQARIYQKQTLSEHAKRTWG